MNQNILIAEDEADIRSILRLYLESEGYAVIETDNGEDALALAAGQAPDLAILDVMMPKLDGYAVTRELRKRSDIPILILSAKSQDNDKILGLNLGADDYIAKPFNALEVVARVRAQLRRAGRSSGSAVTLGGLTLDRDACTVSRNGEILPLTPMEYKLLAVLMGAPGRIFTKAQLFEAVSGEYYESDDNTVMVHISRLREKIEDDPRKPVKLVTVSGLGYKFESK